MPLLPSSPAARRLLLAVALLAGLVLRVAALDTYGFSEDETAKLRAIEAYRRGEFAVNAEHPMLMKLAMWASLSLAAGDGGLSQETALRLPNALAGTATIAVTAAVASRFFGPWVGVLAALLVAADPNVVGVNRIGKEDTFLLLFFLIAVWCYENGKRAGVSDLGTARRWYTASGAAFGLMLASKYMPHLLGLYALFNVIADRHPGDNRPDKRRYYAAMACAFIAANPAVLHPDTWRYIATYLRGGMLTHHGFHYSGALYVTDVPVSLAGVPASYYLTLIGTKVPVLVLAAAVVGLVPLLRRRGERGFVWLRVLLLFQAIGYSAAAAKFQRYALPILVLLDILAAVGIVAVASWITRTTARPMLRAPVAAAAAAAVVIASVVAVVRAAPFYSLHQNAIGARLARPATIFPEEAYDYGVREAVGEIVRRASPGAVVVSDAPGVVGHYVRRAGREDIDVLSLSQRGLVHGGEQWILVQDGHLYFENVSAVHQLRRAGRVWREYRLMDTPVLQVYHLSM